MSAIIAGNECKGCKQKYWLSFGSPDWWKNVVMKNQSPDPVYLMYDEMRRSGMCPKCWALWKIENELETMSDNHLGFLAFLFEIEEILP